MIALTDRENAVVVGTINGDRPMTIATHGAGKSLHDWADRGSERPLEIQSDGTVQTN